MNSFKTFTDFGKGLEEIANIIPEVKEITDSISEDIANITPKQLTAALIDIVMDDFPYVDYRSPAVSVSYKEVGYKSRYSLSFGWKYITDGSGKMSYSFRISFYNRSHSIVEIEKKLLELGWTQPAERKSFFPYKDKQNFHKKETEKKPRNGKFNKKKNTVEEEKVEVAEPVSSEEVTNMPDPEEKVEEKKVNTEEEF